MNKVDLHTHTYYSDGLLSPKQLIILAKKRNISAISITDHDTIDGIVEGRKFAEKNNLEYINGVEIYSRDTEILGYLFDENDSALTNFLEKQIKFKKENAIQKIEKLNDLNVDIEIEEIYDKIKPGRVVTGTHIANLMVEKKYGKNVKEIYDKYMNKIKVKLENPPIDTRKTIKTIIDAGGIAILPHPWYLKEHIKENLDLFLIKLQKYGLSGIETIGYIPEELKKIKGTNFIKYTKEISRELDFVETGGSDFHSEKIHPHNILGKYNIPYSKLKELKKRNVK